MKASIYTQDWKKLLAKASVICCFPPRISCFILQEAFVTNLQLLIQYVMKSLFAILKDIYPLTCPLSLAVLQYYDPCRLIMEKLRKKVVCIWDDKVWKNIVSASFPPCLHDSYVARAKHIIKWEKRSNHCLSFWQAAPARLKNCHNLFALGNSLETHSVCGGEMPSFNMEDGCNFRSYM